MDIQTDTNCRSASLLLKKLTGFNGHLYPKCISDTYLLFIHAVTTHTHTHIHAHIYTRTHTLYPPPTTLLINEQDRQTNRHSYILKIFHSVDSANFFMLLNIKHISSSEATLWFQMYLCLKSLGNACLFTLLFKINSWWIFLQPIGIGSKIILFVLPRVASKDKI